MCHFLLPSMSGLKTVVSYDKKASSMKSGEKPFKTLQNSIVRNSTFFSALKQNYQSFSKTSLYLDL